MFPSREYHGLNPNRRSSEDSTYNANDDKDSYSSPRSKQSQARNQTTFILLIIIFLSTLLTSGISFTTLSILTSSLSTPSSSSPATQPPNLSTSINNCGETISFAQKAGCTFDLLTNNWVPAACSDEETNNEFRAWVSDTSRLRESWPYYYDGKGEHQIQSEGEMSRLIGQRLYTTTENHLGHCTFLMRRLHRFLDSRGNEEKVLSRISMNHTVHCSAEILRALGKAEFEDRGRITSGFDIGIVGC